MILYLKIIRNVMGGGNVALYEYPATRHPIDLVSYSSMANARRAVNTGAAQRRLVCRNADLFATYIEGNYTWSTKY